MLVVALSMLITPLLFILHDRIIVHSKNTGEERQADEISHKSPIIIIGHGRIGGVVSRMLQAANYEPTVIDYSSSHLEVLRAFGMRVFFGDGTRSDMLEAAGIKEAKLLVIAIDDKEKITKLCQYAIKNYPDLHVVARAVNRQHVYDLWSAGCRDIIRESYDSSLRMGRTAIEALGIEKTKAQHMAKEFETMDRQSMLELASLNQLNMPMHQNEAYLDAAKKLNNEWTPILQERMRQIVEAEVDDDSLGIYSLQDSD